MDYEKRSGLFVAQSQKGYGGFLGPCPYVEGPEKFLLEITNPLGVINWINADLGTHIVPRV